MCSSKLCTQQNRRKKILCINKNDSGDGDGDGGCDDDSNSLASLVTPSVHIAYNFIPFYLCILCARFYSDLYSLFCRFFYVRLFFDFVHFKFSPCRIKIKSDGFYFHSIKFAFLYYTSTVDREAEIALTTKNEEFV